MIRRNRQLLSLALALLDGALALGSYCLCAWLWLDLFKRDVNMASVRGGHPHMLLMAALFSLFVVLVMAVMGLYDASRTRRLRQEFPRVWGSNLLGLLAGMALMYLVRAEDFSRGVIFSYYLVSSALLCLRRYLLRLALSGARKRGYNQRHVVVLGSGALARQYAENIAADPSLGFHLLGFLGDGAAEEGYLGPIGSLDDLLNRQDVDEVVAALEPGEVGAVREIIAACERSGTKVSVIPFYNDLIPASAAIERIGTSRVINLRANPLDNAGYALIKRCFDLAASALLLIVLSPLLAVCAIGVKLSSPGPILFRQERVGRNKKLFQMYKFRSMRLSGEEDTAWTRQGDPRKTRFGALMRRLSIDELPQLLNVLRGEMSLVGPRPEIPFYVEQFKDSVPLYMVKHQVRPGMTGWAQVNGWRGDTDIATRIRYDVWYIENWSIRLDIKILLMTALGGFVSREE